MVKVNIAGNYDGKPLAVLSDFIKERQRILGESAQDAVIATGIDALLSLRALTKVAKKRIPKSDVRFGREDPQYIIGTRGKATGKLYRRVVVGRWKNGAKRNIVRWQQVDGVAKNRRATSRELSAAWQRWGTINNRGLAKFAFGVAMNSISTRNKVAPLNARTSKLAAANVRVRTHGGKDAFTLEVRDSLGYAVQALRGGQAAVDLALKRAANKIAGRLCRVAEKKFGERIATPFPEVRKRRAS